MDANLERQGEEKLRLRMLPDIFPSMFIGLSKRNDKEMDSKATMNQRCAVKKQMAPNAREVISHIALNNIENVKSPITRRYGAKTSTSTTEIQTIDASNNLPVMFPSDKQEALRMLALKPATKKPVACGFSEKSNPEIDEIDLPDVFNHLAVVEYVQDLYTFYKQQQHVGRPTDYMDKQPHINPKMRAILVDWITDVHFRYNLLPETLYLTIYIIDRYLSLDGVKRLQLVGMCSLLIACKYEELRAPRVNDLMDIAFNKYTREEILGMEKTILNKLEWYLTVPTAYMFLVRFVKVAKADQELEHMIYFLAELGLMQYDLIKYCPSIVAASAVYTACCTLGKSRLWTNALERHTSFSEPQLLECARVLVKAHWTAPGSNLKVVYNKYMLQQFGGVARYPPAMSLIEA
ncbi:G2/mitotic-specific cyclin S13-7-like isoform X1 [Carex littledalei]|uniref:G2/mitotic-specific cyclin S13-7-like isoform X1 n=1 Tax=Carex littledalei TaxID=544730 RepID=A0A833QNY9_9POAL|nr:G2/mitotic-specific cyclin S13-7-like isoform X1 [Carex littledalei]